MMAGPHEGFANVNKFIHEPTRLSILTALLDTGGADYVLLLHLTGLPKGSLSTQLRKLEEAGLLRTEKSFVRRKSRTMAELTEEGRSAIEGYLEDLERLHEQRRRWVSTDKERVRQQIFNQSYGDTSGAVTP
jgi:DNA-binding MarR family transcriptional regulator